MTPQEAEASHDVLRDAYKNIFAHGDNFIQGTTTGHEEVYIWSSIDEEQIEVLVNVRLRRAQRSAAEARILRGIIALHDQIMEFVILGPRIGLTANIYWERGFDIPGGHRRKRKKTVEGSVAANATT